MRSPLLFWAIVSALGVLASGAEAFGMAHTLQAVLEPLHHLGETLG